MMWLSVAVRSGGPSPALGSVPTVSQQRSVACVVVLTLIQCALL